MQKKEQKENDFMGPEKGRDRRTPIAAASPHTLGVKRAHGTDPCSLGCSDWLAQCEHTCAYTHVRRPAYPAHQSRHR